MPVPTPFHRRTSALCRSLYYKDWAGYHAVRSYDVHHDPEYFAFRNAAGLLDVSPLCKYEVTGSDAAEYLSFVMARDVTRLKVGRVTYACFCDAQGKVIDDGTVARLERERFRVTSASPSFYWLDRHRRGFDVDLADVSESTAALALQGPTSRDVLRGVVGDGIDALRFFAVASASIAGVDVDISRTGYTGDLGYEIWIPAGDALPVWDALFEAGRPHGLEPAGLDALDVTRVEAGFVLQGVDYFSAPRCLIDERKSSPFEIGLGWTVSLDRDPFIGQPALRAEAERGSAWQLVGLEIAWDALESLYGDYRLPPKLPGTASRDAVPVYDGARQVGQTTSRAWSPILKRFVALASVRSDYATLGRRLDVEHTVEFERRRVRASVVPRPFFDPERKRA